MTPITSRSGDQCHRRGNDGVPSLSGTYSLSAGSEQNLSELAVRNPRVPLQHFASREKIKAAQWDRPVALPQ